MEKGHESAPPYVGPPFPAGGGMSHPGMNPQPGFSPGSPAFAGYPGGPPPAYHQPNFSPAPSPYPASYPAYPAGVYPAAVPAQAVPVTVVTQMARPRVLQEFPGQIVCQHCQQTVITNTEPTSGVFTWLMCAFLAVFGFFLCCWIPFIIDSCKDVEHHCPSCNKVVYLHRRDENCFYPRRNVIVTQAYI